MEFQINYFHPTDGFIVVFVHTDVIVVKVTARKYAVDTKQMTTHAQTRARTHVTHAVYEEEAVLVVDTHDRTHRAPRTTTSAATSKCKRGRPR